VPYKDLENTLGFGFLLGGQLRLMRQG